jgi:signal peptidase I
LDTASNETGATGPTASRNQARAILWEVLQTAILALLVFLVVNLTTARVRVSGPSMKPTLEGGEYILVSRLAYRWGSPQRGDIVVLHSPDPGTSEDLIKRIVGLPGDTVGFVGGHVWLNGASFNEPYAVGLTGSEQTWHLGPSQLFVLGDNRAFSRDSHNFGPVPINDVVGKAWLIYWPPSEWGLADHRALQAGAGTAASWETAGRRLTVGRKWGTWPPGAEGFPWNAEDPGRMVRPGMDIVVWQ